MLASRIRAGKRYEPGTSLEPFSFSFCCVHPVQKELDRGVYTHRRSILINNVSLFALVVAARVAEQIDENRDPLLFLFYFIYFFKEL